MCGGSPDGLLTFDLMEGLSSELAHGHRPGHLGVSNQQLAHDRQILATVGEETAREALLESNPRDWSADS